MRPGVHDADDTFPRLDVGQQRSESAFDDGIEQRVFVAEVAVDRRGRDASVAAMSRMDSAPSVSCFRSAMDRIRCFAVGKLTALTLTLLTWRR